MPETLNMTKGLIPLPPMEETLVDVSRRYDTADCPRGYDNLGFRPFPKVLVVHRAQSPDSPYGTLEGYFHSRCCPALTDMEVNHRTGVGKRFVALPGASPSGWASGPISAPYGDGKAFNDLYPYLVNRYGESCEVLGRFRQPGTSSQTEDVVLQPARDFLARWFASRGHDYGIRYTDFPNIIAEGGRSIVTWHEEYTFGTGKVCPGETVKLITSELIEMARAIMKKAQTMSDPTPVPAPVLKAPDGLAWPEGLDTGMLSIMFGVLRKDGRVWGFNPNGTISKAWYIRGKAQGRYPFLYDHFVDLSTGREYFVFSDGSYIWKPKGTDKFRWG